MLTIVSNGNGANPDNIYQHPLKTPSFNKEWVVVNKGRVEAESGKTLSLYRLNYLSEKSTPEEAAFCFFEENKTSLGLNNPRSELVLHKTRNSKTTTHTHFIQISDGLPLYGGYVQASSTLTNVITNIQANLIYNFDLTNRVPSISASHAIETSRNYLNSLSPRFPVSTPELVGFSDSNGLDFLAWLIKYPSSDPLGDWEILVDAHNSSILSVKNRMMFVNGSGMVFQPDPLTSSNSSYWDPGFLDDNDNDTEALTNELRGVILRGISLENGLYELIGPYVQIEDIEAPFITPAVGTNSNDFQFQRSESGFEDVNAYFHIDKMQRYIQGLGYLNLQNGPIQVDPHGVNGADLSYYSPFMNSLIFGEGGVDDAEDADVLIHEYGHAIQNAASGTLSSDDMLSICEGYSDYLAGSYSATISSFRRDLVYNWDGHNEFWNGRVLTSPETYSEDWNDNSIYENGSIWANTLWRIRNQIPTNQMDAMILQSLYYLSPEGVALDAAEGLFQAESDLYGGAYRQIIYQNLVEKGFIDAERVIRGTVTSSFPGLPIEGAFVKLGSNSYYFCDTTEVDGSFEFYVETDGAYEINVEADGYFTVNETVVIDGTQPVVLQIQLEEVNIAFNVEEFHLRVVDEVIVDTFLTISNSGDAFDWAITVLPERQETSHPLLPFAEFSVSQITGDQNIYDVTSVNDMIVLAGYDTGNSPEIFLLNALGDLLGQSDQPTENENGFSSITSDGELLYGSDNNLIVGFNRFGLVVSTIPTSLPNIARIAYDEERDWFWCADGSQTITAISHEGAVLDLIEIGSDIAGLGYYPYALDGFTLFAAINSEGDETGIIFINPQTHQRSELLNLSGNESGIINGCSVFSGIEEIPNYWFLGSLLNDQSETTLMLSLIEQAVPQLKISPKRGRLESFQFADILLQVHPTRQSETEEHFVLHLAVANSISLWEIPLTVEIYTVDQKENTLPDEFRIDPPYPNPFNSSTTVNINLPEKSYVQIVIYDLLSREVDRIEYGMRSSGEKKFIWKTEKNLASGLYFLQVNVENQGQSVFKTVLVK